MKLASLPQRRDGRLIVVSDDLAWYADADHIVPTMQGLLDAWDNYAPLLESLAIELAHRAIPTKRFHEREAAAPLPRAFRRADGAAHGNRAAALRPDTGSGLPASSGTEPLLADLPGDDLRGGREPIEIPGGTCCDVAAAVCVVTGDVPQGVSAADALGFVRLVGLTNTVVPARLEGEPATSSGAPQANGPTHFSPVFVTPEGLASHWRDGRLQLSLAVSVNGHALGQLDAAQDCLFGFGELIAALAKSRRIGAGAIIGSGPVANSGPGGTPGRPVGEGGRGFACLAELRAAELAVHAEPRTPFLQPGDTVRIEMRDERGKSVFGAIEQYVVAV